MKGREWIRKREGRVWEETETPLLGAKGVRRKKGWMKERVRTRKGEVLINTRCCLGIKQY